MILLAYLMTRTEEWRGASIRLITFSLDDAKEKTLEQLRQTLEQVRIEADPVVVNSIDSDSVARESASSTLVFFPLRFREGNLLGDVDASASAFLENMPITAFCLAAADIDLEAGPEDGEIAEVAAAHDLAVDLEEQARAAEEEVMKLARAVDQALEERKKSGESDAQALRELREALTKAARKAADLRAQADEAVERAAESGAKLPSDKETKDAR